MNRLVAIFACLALILSTTLFAAENNAPGAVRQRIPLIDVTDLYHPHQDVGDNFDLIAAYALPEIDLRAVILDCSEPFRQPVAKNPGPGLFEDRDGPREPGFIPVLQLNYIFGRNVPCGVSPFTRMKSVGDKMLDAPPFQQQGIELILKTLGESTSPLHIVSFGSARAIAAAYNREPALFRKKLARIHLCAGGSSPPAPGYIEWNVALDPLAVVCLLRSDLPIAIYPDAANNAGDKAYNAFSPAFSYDSHNTFYKLPNRRFIPRMDPPLRRYLEFAFGRCARADFLRAMEVDGPPLAKGILAGEHNVWETAVWICLTGRRLAKRRRQLPPARTGRSLAQRRGSAEPIALMRGAGAGQRRLFVPRDRGGVELLGLLPRRSPRERACIAKRCRRFIFPSSRRLARTSSREFSVPQRVERGLGEAFSGATSPCTPERAMAPRETASVARSNP